MLEIFFWIKKKNQLWIREFSLNNQDCNINNFVFLILGFDISAAFDSVSICLSKGLSCPMGVSNIKKIYRILLKIFGFLIRQNKKYFF